MIFPERASDFAVSVDAIFYSLLALCGLITLGIVAVMLWFCIYYRQGAKVRRRPLPTRKQSYLIEAGWTGVTVVIFLGIFAWAGVIYVRMARPPANATEIDVVAKQWMWKTQHANGRREIDELHLVLGQPVKLIMTSQDVIHDFFVPAFRTKQDVLPGRYTTEWFTPTKPGRYRLFCAEYCGMNHSRMGGWVYVMEAPEYARWLAGGEQSESLVAAGERLFTARGCSGCHAAHGTVRAPLLEGIFNKPVALNDRRIVIADEQYLHDSILQPNKDITAGYEPLMPTYQGQLSEEEVMALIAYLKTR